MLWAFGWSSCVSTQGIRRQALQKSRPHRPIGHQRAMQVVYGKASYYAAEFHGRRTASGEIYNMYALTAAHRSWPFGTICRVINLKNHRSVVVRINDRGPFVANRILDLSYGAAKALDALGDGVIDVKIEVLKFGKDLPTK